MELMEAITKRRSVRKYKPDMPAQEDIDCILEAARWAPSWANTQCTVFILVTDAEVKGKLAETLPEKNPARAAMTHAPVVIAACGIKEKSGFFKAAAATDKGDWLMFDTALALQNLTLAAHARGLGTVHVGFFDALKAGEVLGVPENVAVVELLPLGFPAHEPNPTPRRQVEEFVFYNGYGKGKK